MRAIDKIMIESNWLKAVSRLDEERRLSLFSICLGKAEQVPEYDTIEGFADPVLDGLFKRTIIRSRTAKKPGLIALKTKEENDE